MGDGHSIVDLMVAALTGLLAGLLSLKATAGASRKVRALMAMSLAFLVVGCWMDASASIRESVSHVWNATRVAPAFAMVHGYSMYYPQDSGPVVGNIYGPLLAIFYLPCTLFSRPSQALMFGSFMSFALIWSAIFAASKQATRSDWTGWLEALVTVLSLYALTLPWMAIRFTSFSIHSDGPAIGFGLWACVLTSRIRQPDRWLPYMAPALSACLAVASKQIMLPLGVGLVLWCSVKHGGRSALKMAVSWIGALLLTGIVAITTLDPASMWFNVITVPASHPWYESLTTHAPAVDRAKAVGVIVESITQTVLHNLQAWVLAVLLVLVIRWTGKANPTLNSNGTWAIAGLWFIVALALLPASVLGRVKVGGDYNAYSFTMYFSYVGVTVLAINHWRVVAESIRLAVPGLLNPLITAVSLVGLVSFMTWQGYQHWRQSLEAHCPTEAAWAIARERPDTVYCPSDPLVGLMAEGRLYHLDYGIYDRRLAHHPLSEEHFRAHIPSKMEFVILERPLYEAQKYLPPLTERTHEFQPEPGQVYRVRR